MCLQMFQPLFLINGSQLVPVTAYKAVKILCKLKLLYFLFYLAFYGTKSLVTICPYIFLYAVLHSPSNQRMIGAVVSFYWIWRLYSQILQSDHQCLSHRPILEHICKSIFSELSVHICDMLSHVELYPLTLQFSVYGVKAFCRRHIYAAYS